MFGLIHDALEDFVVRVFGEDKWHEILRKTNIHLKGASFLMYKNYDDRVTWKLILVASNVLALDFETVLEALGNHFIKYTCHHGYEKILKSLGTNLHDFLANIDFLHEHLSTVFMNFKPPSFRVTHSTEGSMRLHYYSERKGLSSFVRGIVSTAAYDFFKTEVIVNQISSNTDGHILFEVINKSIDPNSEAFEKIRTPFTDSSLSASPSSLFFSVETLCEAFPFHFVFKRNFAIIEMGNSLKRYVTLETTGGTGVGLAKSKSRVTNKKIMFSDMFIITRPIIELNFDTILTFSNHIFVLTTREEYVKQRGKKASSAVNVNMRQYTLSPEKEDHNLRLRLKGQMISLPAYDAILFLGSPKIDIIDEMVALDLTMTDFPIHDANGFNIMSRTTKSDDQVIISKIDRAANHLKIVEKKLRIEIDKNNRILQEIFPAKIARILCQNIKVDAEYFQETTCLFSDICNFTAMCLAPNIKAIDIIRLLNRLYIQFDNQTNYYGTYKVETVGDAYLVVSGVPEPVEDHADRVVEMGLAMVHVTRTIFSPSDGKHIEMRIGIHSGPCMAGIVGLSMPRYAVFGNTVMLANKMEFAGPEGMVHISEATKRSLKKDKYYFMQTNLQNMFDFPTYIVTKLYEEYHEDHLVVENNLNMAGGLFKSPTSSPTHNITNSRLAATLNRNAILSDTLNPLQQYTIKRMAAAQRNAAGGGYNVRTNVAKLNSDMALPIIRVDGDFNENSNSNSNSNSKNDISKSKSNSRMLNRDAVLK